MDTFEPSSDAIKAIRQRLNRFSCLTTPPELGAEEKSQMREDIACFNKWSDYQTLGVCADTLEEGRRSLEAFLRALGVIARLDLPGREGAVYLKFNTLKRAWYLDDYGGLSRGVLITFQCSEAETAEVAGTYGPFPLDLYSEGAA
jgi:hypothetical protein